MGADVSNSFRIQKAWVHFSSHLAIHFSFHVKSVRGAAKREESIIKIRKNCSSPMNPLSSVWLVGFGQDHTNSTRSSPTLMLLPLTIMPKNSTSLTQNEHF